MFSIVVAVGKNNEIGCDNKLMWNIPEDLKNFKEITTGKKIVMGRKTFESIGRKLPNRENIIISRNLDDEYAKEKGITVYNNIEDVIEKYGDVTEEVFILGGSQIYRELLPFCNKLYISYIDYENENADAYFPDFDEKNWTKIEEKNYENWKFVIYKKI